MAKLHKPKPLPTLSNHWFEPQDRIVVRASILAAIALLLLLWLY